MYNIYFSLYLFVFFKNEVLYTSKDYTYFVFFKEIVTISIYNDHFIDLHLSTVA